MKRVRLLVEGRVQGVGYRYHTCAAAAEAGVTGWVRNLPDGRVEVEIEGPEDAVDSVVAWCRRGPAFSHVSGVQVVASEPVDSPRYAGFTLRT